MTDEPALVSSSSSFSLPPSSSPSPALPPWLAPAASAAMIAFAVFLRILLFGDRVLPVGFGIPLVLFAWLRSRRWMWVTALGFAAISVFKFLFLIPRSPTYGPLVLAAERVEDIGLLLLDLAVIAGLVHLLIGVREGMERRNAELAAANHDLAVREEELARANEELQSQAEELERQSEELRVTNDDLSARERTLATLLSLSRSLATDLSLDQTLERICETMGELINGPATATAILEREGGATGAAGDHLVVRCHHGFAGGLREEKIHPERSFAAVVLHRGRTGYIEDMALRPDLDIPQPREGRPFVSVLAAPLRVAGRPVGTLEVYSQEKGSWTDAQTTLLESLAAQTSVSLEAAHLFESVQQERRRLEAVLRAAPIGIAVANADCTDIRLNPAGATAVGVPPDTNIAVPGLRETWRAVIDGKLVTPEDLPLTIACREGREVHGVEAEVYVADNRRLTVLMNAAPIRRPDAAVTGAVAAFINITPLKDLQRELDLRRREAEEANVRKTRFLAAVSHDIRTPANAISLLAELIRRSATNPALAAEVPELAQELHGSAVALVNLLSDVLDVARFDSGRVELQESEFSLATLLAEETRQMQPLARDKGLELQYTPPPQPIVLRADRIKLSRVLGNLVGNAIKFTERGFVRIEAAASADGGAEIRVTDSGVGIAPEHQRHIFDEFFQLTNPERDRNKGTGLGLTICKRLVDAMGGRLDVSSAPGEGSTFTITLPPAAVVPAPSRSE